MTPDPTSSNSPATILVVDDSLLIRAVVRGNLEGEGYVVVEAEDGAAAVEECRQRPPDVILLDVEMPGLNGYEVLALLKANRELKNIPVVFLTSRSRMEDVLAGLRGGAHDYLKKPFETAELMARVGSALHVKQLQDELRMRNAALEKMARTDALTGLFNRRHLDDELRRRHSAARRHHEPLCLLLLDIDHFKRINDTYGHPVGDLVLCAFSEVLRAGTREEDVSGRWGGEEFLVILPRTELNGATEVADRIRLAVAREPISVAGQDIFVTVSGGCALGPSDSVDSLLREVDLRLYEAKASGRDRIAPSPPPSEELFRAAVMAGE